MTNNQIYNINDYSFSQMDAVLFDANIWLYIYGRQGERYPRIKATYTLALRRIRSVKGRILVDGFVLAEFINAYARFFYNILPEVNKPAEFKIYRNSAEFKPFAQEIARQSRKILEKCERVDSGFETADWREILRKYAAGESDFNDQILAELCKAKNLKLVTHDADFKGDNLTIITANPKLLNSEM
ncbi:type II toxin-antitoxin system VapC family toxin [Aerosakkonema sp. BLCC-F183]|uniref:type II toxin-antitoxin system VapC family toxin n=1 Tax=Aerosakkonema sp. BLCC-F183 TaxID=3342834 RepID=UPI0035B9D2C5